MDFVDSSTVEKVFEANPTLLEAFYRFLALQMVEKLRAANQIDDVLLPQPLSNSQGSYSDSATPEFNSSNSKFRNKFSLPSTEVLLKKYSCSLPQVSPICGLTSKERHHNGALFLSSNYLCFRGKIFGSESKVKL